MPASMESPPPFDLTLTLLGPPKWSRPDGAGGPLSRKDALLLALLVLEGEQARDRLAAWLWPEASAKRGNVSLRQRLFKLRQTTGHPLVVAGLTLQLAAGVLADVKQAEASLDAELLGGFDYGDLDAADQWLQVQRQHLQHRRLDQAVGRAARLEAEGAWAAAIEACEAVLLLAATHEHTWRRLMRLHYLRGDRTSAIHTFERMESTVLAEQGSRPSAETQELLRAIEAMQTKPVAPLHALPASLVRPPVMVGRSGALQALQQAWELCQPALVLGNGGLGKSRLLAEFLAVASHGHAQGPAHGQPQGPSHVQATRARPGDEAMPYAVLCPVLQALIDRYQPPLAVPLRAELARLLPTLGAPAGGAGQQATLWRAVESLLAACQGRGLQALVVDDLHFADLASLELLRWLFTSPGLAELRFVFAARPDEPGAATAQLQTWGGDSSRLVRVTLAPLSQAEVHDLVQTLHLDALQAVTPDFAAALFRHAGGHPFFTLETLKASLQQGRLHSPQPGLPTPASVKTMIERRLARLSLPAQDLLRLAAVAGAGLQADWVAAALQRPVIDLAPAWAELEAAQVMHGAAFAHDLVREAALDSVPPALRAVLHGQWARVLQASGSAEPSRLAHHWWEAQAWPAAAAALRQAAAAARMAGRLQEQEELLERAALAHDHAGDAAAGFAARREAAAVFMMRQGSEAALQRLPALLAQAATDDQRASVLSLQAEALLNLARYADAMAAAKAAVAALKAAAALADSESALLAFDAESLYARALALNGHPAQAVDLLQRSCQSALALRDTARSLVAHSALAHAQFAAGQVGASVRSQHTAFTLAERLGDAAEIAQTAGNLATLASIAGDTVYAYRYAGEAERRFHAMGADAGHGVFNRLILARSAAHLARIDEALPLLQAAAQQGGGQAGVTSQTLAAVALGVLHLWLGRAQQVLDGPPALPADVHPLAAGSVHLLLARAHSQCGGDTSGPMQAFEALAQRHPELAANPVLCLEWARFAPIEPALERLRHLRAQARQSGADGMARSLALRELGRLLEADPAAAAALAQQIYPEMHMGQYPSTYPPEAWWVLSRALPEHDKDLKSACLASAHAWIQDVHLPEPQAMWRPAFLQGNPVNQQVMRGG
jgi:DNA-binding SARP family transcriptional activator